MTTLFQVAIWIKVTSDFRFLGPYMKYKTCIESETYGDKLEASSCSEDESDESSDNCVVDQSLLEKQNNPVNPPLNLEIIKESESESEYEDGRSETITSERSTPSRESTHMAKEVLPSLETLRAEKSQREILSDGVNGNRLSNSASQNSSKASNPLCSTNQSYGSYKMFNFKNASKHSDSVKLPTTCSDGEDQVLQTERVLSGSALMDTNKYEIESVKSEAFEAVCKLRNKALCSTPLNQTIEEQDAEEDLNISQFDFENMKIRSIQIGLGDPVGNNKVFGHLTDHVVHHEVS